MTNYQIIRDKSFLKISGSDAFSFLQGIMTADISDLERREAVYSLMLTPQGKYLSDFFIINYENGFLLELTKDRKDQVISKFRMYKLRSDVQIEDLSDRLIVIFSEEEMSGLNPILSYNDPRIENSYKRSIMAIEHLPELHNKDTEFYNLVKYQNGIIDGSDMIPEKSIPIEYGLDYMNAISFTKGCYVGQEVISRVKHTGMLRKQIYLAKSDDEIINAKSGDELLIDGAKSARICSIWRNYALLLLNIGEESPENYANILIAIGQQNAQMKIPSWRKK